MSRKDGFQRVMQALGVSDQLKANGASNGDLIMVGDVDFRYFEETPMAARARLAGFVDAPEEEGGELSEEEVERRRQRQLELDKELAAMLDEDGEVMLF